VAALQHEGEALAVGEDRDGGRAAVGDELQSDQPLEEGGRGLDVGDLEIEMIDAHRGPSGQQAALRRGTSPHRAGIKGSRFLRE